MLPKRGHTLSAPKLNSPCSGGSGQKFKNCCAQQQWVTAPAEAKDDMLSVAAGFEQVGQHTAAEQRYRLAIEQ